MKKLTFLILILTIVLMWTPGIGSATMLDMTNDQLSNVTGQGGICIEVGNLDFDTSIDTLYYGDSDGIAGNTKGGYISLTEVALQGSVEFGSPLTMDIATVADSSGNQEVTGLNFTFSDMDLHIDSFTIDAIRLGPEPGVGPSLGSIGISGMDVHVEGNVCIRTRG
ncbi:MAG: hypothetical protein JRC53_02635 [Deltaproteobacteria bacterium]|nr:hypothetical protein [Deltaproteobacteria bacterium]